MSTKTSNNSYWRLIKDLSRPVSTAEGLAIDDTLPRSVESNGSTPILHLYTFKPSVMVGKYQDIESALKLDRCRELGIEFNRRSTGGGTVIMGPEVLALGLGISMDHPGLNKGVGGVFKTLSRILIEALAKCGVRADFRPKNDLEVNGKKIAGLSAASEIGKSILFHTSLLGNFDIHLMLEIMNTPLIKVLDKGYSCFSERMTTLNQETGRNVPIEEIADSVRISFEETFGINFFEDTPDPWEEKTINDLICERYNNPDWIFSHKHPRSRMGVGRLKTNGGLLEIFLSLAGGSIENITITGDFFSTSEDITCLESALKWTSCREEMVVKNLSEVWRQDMIYGIDAHTLTRAIMEAKKNQVRL